MVDLVPLVVAMIDNLIIFSRYPEPGKTKTRMIPALGAEGAAKLQKRLSEHTLKQAKNFQKLRPIEIAIYFSGGDRNLMRNWLGDGIEYIPQASGDLGSKMYSAFSDRSKILNHKTVIIGIDCPGIDCEILNLAFTNLENNDLVLGKAADGGYYLIGLNCHKLSYKPPRELFININWGTEKVFSQTVAIAKALNLNTSVLPTLRDIDRPEDLDLVELI